jgi:hypothetical protein|tara:strand:+ start:2643 stop:3095 length:453 start_codon:yes stop_codon:yes gene_type:complete
MIKKVTKEYESESSAIRRIQTGESLWDNIHKKRARIKGGSGEKMRKKGAKGAPTPDQMKRAQEETEESINIEEGLKDQLTPKLIQLLRMGMVDQEDLEVMKRAIKTDRNSLQNPLLRDKLYELLEKLLDAVNDDSQIWLRLRNRIQKGEI